MSRITEQEIPQTVQYIRDRLAVVGPRYDIRLQVEDEDYRLDEDWLLVTVVPLDQGIKSTDYAHALSDVEKELREEGVDNVLLMPPFAD